MIFWTSVIAVVIIVSSFSFAAPLSGILLPLSLRTCTSITSFYTRLKIHLFPDRIFFFRTDYLVNNWPVFDLSLAVVCFNGWALCVLLFSVADWSCFNWFIDLWFIILCHLSTTIRMMNMYYIVLICEPGIQSLCFDWIWNLLLQILCFDWLTATQSLCFDWLRAMQILRFDWSRVIQILCFDWL